MGHYNASNYKNYYAQILTSSGWTNFHFAYPGQYSIVAYPGVTNINGVDTRKLPIARYDLDIPDCGTSMLF